MVGDTCPACSCVSKMEIMNVRIRYFDERLVEESLRRYLKEIEEKHPEVKRVLLFGSFVRDECVPGSDIDLLLILSASEETFMERIPRFLPSRFPVGMDVFPYTIQRRSWRR